MVQIQQGPSNNDTCRRWKKNGWLGWTRKSKIEKTYTEYSEKTVEQTLSDQPLSPTYITQLSGLNIDGIKLWIWGWRFLAFALKWLPIFEMWQQWKKSQCVRNKNTTLWKMLEELLKKRENKLGCFIGSQTTRRGRVLFDPIKHVLRTFLNGLKNIPRKAWVNRQLCFCKSWKLAFEKNIRH